MAVPIATSVCGRNKLLIFLKCIFWANYACVKEESCLFSYLLLLMARLSGLSMFFELLVIDQLSVSQSVFFY